MARASRPLTPHSVDEVLAEGILVAGGGRAILLQLAHPAVAQGVAEHSGFALDPVRRLVGTLEYVYVIAFGTEDEIRRIGREVGAAHRKVRGDGDVPYDARDPDLQLWVAATLYETTVAITEQVWGPLTEQLADELYERGAHAGTALGMPRSSWPADRRAFAEYWERMVAGLSVTPTARRLAWTLMRPAAGPAWMFASMPLVRLATAGLLPESLRAAYGVRWNDDLQRRYDRLLRITGAVYRMLPGALRRLPSRLFLRRFRRRTTAPGVSTNQGEIASPRTLHADPEPSATISP